MTRIDKDYSVQWHSLSLGISVIATDPNTRIRLLSMIRFLVLLLIITTKQIQILVHTEKTQCRTHNTVDYRYLKLKIHIDTEYSV